MTHSGLQIAAPGATRFLNGWFTEPDKWAVVILPYELSERYPPLYYQGKAWRTWTPDIESASLSLTAARALPESICDYLSPIVVRVTHYRHRSSHPYTYPREMDVYIPRLEELPAYRELMASCEVAS